MARYTVTELQQQIAELQAKLAQADVNLTTTRSFHQSELRALVDKHEKELAELRKQIESERNSARWAGERSSEYKGELDAAHALIDAIDCPLPRKSKRDPNDYSETENSLVLRIGAWLAKKAGMGVQ